MKNDAIDECWQDLCLDPLLGANIRVVAKTALIPSEEAKHNTWEEGGKASGHGQFARSTQNSLSEHIHWIEEN